MRGLCAAASLFVCLVSAAPAAMPGFTNAEFAARRQAMRRTLGKSVLALYGYTARDVDELRTGFYQEPNFLYLTGWNEPGAILLLTSESETLFLPPRNAAVERYTGAKIAPGDTQASEATGFDQVLSVAQFEAQFAKAAESAEAVLTVRDRRDLPARLERLTPKREIRDARAPIAALRAKKSPAEIAWIEKATQVSMDAHRAAWRRIKPGVFEYQAAATMVFAMLDRNCRTAYTPIIASGPNGPVLHYAENSRQIGNGELIVMDVAASCGEYASDITRTVPSSRKFTPRQRELYEAVLGAGKAAIAAVRPGATMQEINKIAKDYLEAHGKLGKYLTHGISHGVGLEAHDAPAHTSQDKFEPGMVITIEPGVYLPEESTGIRIEDLVLVTATGARVLSAALPKDPATSNVR
ncbi:MAG TPA: Xaa-Pro peptidase family protein [Bryobacteraceae bacterium]|nr:Xaa-Pro peptidase family protein [Bryobacteraceae bacterium]